MSAASKHTALALLSLAFVAAFTLAGSAAGGRFSKARDREAPSAPTNLRVTSTLSYSLGVAWDASTDSVGVVGYYLYVNDGRGDGRRTRVTTTSYVAGGLACGQSVDIWVSAYDAAGNRSPQVSVTAPTAACPDLQAPTTPTGFWQQATTQSAVVLAWTPASDNVGVVGYGIYRNALPVTTTPDPTVTVGGLTCGSAYQYQVDAVDASGNRSARGSAWVQTADCGDSQPPTVPSNLAVTGSTASSLALSWTASSDNVGVAGYRVSVGSAPVATVSSTNAALKGLSCGTSFTVGVDAYDAAGNESAPATKSAKTADCAPAGDTLPPTQPSGLAASNATETSLILGWNASTDNVGVTGYDVYRNGTKVATVTGTSASQSGLTCGTTYSFGVIARDAAGNSSTQAQVSASTADCPPPPPSPDTTPPTQPTGLAASNTTQTGLDLGWNASTDNVAVTGYDVYRDGVKVATVTGTSAPQSGLTCGTTYSFGVVARDAAANSSTQTQVSAATAACSPPPPAADTTPPSPPSGLALSVSTATSVTLTWLPSTDNVGVVGYGIYKNGSLVASPATPGGIVSGLACGTAYTLAVDAYDLAGNRSTRASVTASTAACADTQPPSSPGNITTTSRTATSIALSWSASTDNVGVTGYTLFRDGSEVSTVTSATGIFSSLACNTNYTLAVGAYDAAGNHSSRTSVMVATTACPDTTPPSTPAGLAASNVTQSSLDLSWNASSDNVAVSGYDVYRNGTKMSTVTSTSSNQSGLACGTSYTFGVVAFDVAGNRSGQGQLSVSTPACAPPTTPTWTSSIADGQTVQTGTTWTATVNPAPDSVEFWDTPSGGTANKLATDTSAPYNVVLNLAAGSHVLGVCAWYGSSRTCFDDRKNVTITSPQSVASYYYNFDFSQIGSPWTSIQTHAPPGWYAPQPPVQQSSDGRVALVAAPDGTGKALRFELNNGDTWPVDTSVDRSQLQMSTQQTWNASALQVGDVRWFDYEIYMPSSFDFPRTNWFTLIGLHPGTNTWGACDLGFDDVGSNSVWMTWKVAGGSPVGTTANLKYLKLWQLTNADGSKYTPSYNRRIHLVVGARFAPDNTGWLEIWVDGVNVYPRTNRPTMWTGDTASYLKVGPYKSESSPFPSGKSVIYFTRVAISSTQPPTS